MDWSTVKVGTEVKYFDRLLGDYKYGYFAGLAQNSNCVIVSKINTNYEFSGLTITSPSICNYISVEDISLHNE